MSGVLRVTIVDAKLPHKGKYNSLYCVPFINSKKLSATKKIKKSKNPMWAHSFSVPVKLSDSVTFTIYNENKIGRDDVLGNFNLPFLEYCNHEDIVLCSTTDLNLISNSPVSQNSASSFFVESADCVSSSDGGDVVKLRVMYSCIESSTTEKVLKERGQVLSISVVSGMDIIPKENGDEDFYCGIEVQNEIYRTSVIPCKGTTATWNENFVIFIKEETKNLKIFLYQCSVEDDLLLGTIKLNFEEIPVLSTVSSQHYEHWTEKSYKIETTSKSQKYSPTMKLDVCFLSDTESVETMSSSSVVVAAATTSQSKPLQKSGLGGVVRTPTTFTTANPSRTSSTANNVRGTQSQVTNRVTSMPGSSTTLPILNLPNSVDRISCLPEVATPPSLSKTSSLVDIASQSSQTPHIEEKWALCVKIFSASNLRQWPVSMLPRSHVTIQTADDKVITESLGNLMEFGGQDHVNPNFNQVLVLPIESFGVCTVKVFTTTSIHLTQTVYDHIIGHISFPLKSIPRCPEAFEEDDEDIVKQAITIELGETGEIEDEVLKKIMQNDVTDRVPVIFDCSLARPKNDVKSMLKIRSKKMGIPKVKLMLSLVPAGSVTEAVCEDDPGDLDPKATPITLPEPYKWVIIEEEYPCSVTKLHSTIFEKESTFLQKYFDSQKYTDIDVSEWKEPPEGGNLKNRTVKFMIPASSLTKAAVTTETQSYTIFEPGGYAVNVIAVTPDVPFGTTFDIRIQIVLQKISPKKSLIRVTSEVVFSKSSMLKGQIEKGVKKGVEDCYLAYVEILRVCLCGSSAKKKKKKNTEVSDEGPWLNQPCGFPNLFLVIILTVTLLSILLNMYFVLFSGNSSCQPNDAIDLPLSVNNETTVIDNASHTVKQEL